jgi:hypothetical protein
MDKKLKRYRQNLGRRTGLHFPRFHSEADHRAPFLALLQDPGKSGAEKTGVCCPLTNNDGTSRRQRRIIFGIIKLEPKHIVFWNFYAAYEDKKHPRCAKVDWAVEIERLIAMMPNLKAVLAFGGPAWRGMRDVCLPRGVALLGAPHPGDRGVLPDPKLAEAKIERAWRMAKELQNLSDEGVNVKHLAGARFLRHATVRNLI